MNAHSKIDPIKQSYENQTFVYFDVETIPCQDPEYLSALRDEVKAPGKFSKPESIQAWLDENRDIEARKMLNKTSFDGGRGHACTISWAKNDGVITTRHAQTVSQERAVIADFFADLDPHHSETLVGHNIIGFDIPFLRKRAIVLGLKMPSPSTFPRDPKPWAKTVADTMVMWTPSHNGVSMDRLCGILGIQGKAGFDGSMVADAWVNGKHQTIAEYCSDDVHRTREIHKRFLAAGY